MGMWFRHSCVSVPSTSKIAGGTCAVEQTNSALNPTPLASPIILAHSPVLKGKKGTRGKPYTLNPNPKPRTLNPITSQPKQASQQAPHSRRLSAAAAAATASSHNPNQDTDTFHVSGLIGA